jgi:hypothetical protein
MLLVLLVLLSVMPLEALMSYETLLFSPLVEHQSTAAIYDQKIDNMYSDLYIQLNVMTLYMMHNFAWLRRSSVYFWVSQRGKFPTQLFRGPFAMCKIVRLHSLKLPLPPALYS